MTPLMCHHCATHTPTRGMKSCAELVYGSEPNQMINEVHTELKDQRSSNHNSIATVDFVKLNRGVRGPSRRVRFHVSLFVSN